MPRIYKQLIIAAGSLVLGTLLGFLLYKFAEYDRLHPQKIICLKSHAKSEYVYGYGLRADGKMGMGWHWEYSTICDKEGINPEWEKLHG
jgi:hypothetical protein